MKKTMISVLGVLVLSAFLSGCAFRAPDAAEQEKPAAEIKEAKTMGITPVLTEAAAAEPVRLASAEAEPAVAQTVPAPGKEEAGEPEPVWTPAVPRDPAPAPDSPCLASYEPVLESIRAGTENGVLGDWDPAARQDVEYGYTLEDIDMNGIPELIIGNMADAEDNEVYALFTLSGGQPYPVAFASEEDSWFLSRAGGLYLRRSGDEMNSDYTIYSFSGTKLEAFFGCFSSDGSDGSGYGFYRVTYGDRHSGTAYEESQEEFNSDRESFEATIIALEGLAPIA